MYLYDVKHNENVLRSQATKTTRMWFINYNYSCSTGIHINVTYIHHNNYEVVYE